MPARRSSKHYQLIKLLIFFDSNHFTRAGTFVILYPDVEYYRIYPDEKEKVFKHHALQPYLYLLDRHYSD